MYAGANAAGLIDDGHGYCPFGNVGNHESRSVTWAEAVGKSKRELKALPSTIKEGSAQLSSEVGGGARDFASDPGVRRVSRNTWAVARAAKNAPVTGAALVVAKASGADCGMAKGIMAICGEASAWAFEGGGTTYGNVFVTDMTVAAVTAQPRLLAHETKHADQWATIGSRFGPMYLGAFAIQGECNVFEAWAGYDDGGYGVICP